MHQFVFKCWAVLAIAFLALALGACGDEPPQNACERNVDCAFGEVCHFGVCMDAENYCSSNAGCEDWQECVDWRCQDRETCGKASDCGPDRTCSNGRCVAEQCRNDSHCMSGRVCDEGLCVTVPRQCTAPGQACNPSEATREGFSCEDLGQGYSCYRTCNRYRACFVDSMGNGVPDVRLDCSAGSVCVDDGVTVPVCKPSECSGYFNAEEDCAQTVANNPDAFANGIHCARQGRDFFTCEGAGQATEGQVCSATADCQEGLTCVNKLGPYADLGNESFCARACTNDSMCDGSDQCIGAQSGTFDGVGFCGARCEPFGTDEAQCSDTKACVPVSSQDGYCFRDTNRARRLYEACGNDTQCPDNSACIGLTSTERRCLPMCDPTRSTQSRRDATCPQPTTHGFIKLANLESGVASGSFYIDGQWVLDLNSGEGDEAYLKVESGQRQFELRNSSGSTVISSTLDVVRHEARTVTAVSGELLMHEVARGQTAGSEATTLRFLHSLSGVGSVDVVVVEEGGLITSAQDRILLVEGLAAYAVSAFETADLGDTSRVVDIHVMPAGTADLGLAVASFYGQVLNGGEVATIAVVGNAVSQQAYSLPYSSAPEGRRLGGYCYDFNAPDDPPEIGSGFCLETCRSGDDWGNGSCTLGDRDACSPVGAGLGWCFPAGNRVAGASCSDDDDCGDGTFCDPAGGVCRSYCQPNEQTNPDLGCQGAEVCVPMSGYINFGECRLPCDGGSNYFDPNCPQGAQSCGTAGPFCSPSGDVALGENCGDPREQNCQPGLACAQSGRTLGEVLQRPFSGILGPTYEATCREVCTPFVEDSGCSAGYACSPITPNGESTDLGHCVPAIEEPIRSLGTCDAADIGKMCDQNSYCLPQSSNQCVAESGYCLQLCDYHANRGCTGGTNCVEGFQGGPLFDVFGLCR